MATHSEKVLITGIEGFTGRHLSKYLNSFGFDVYGSVLFEPKRSNEFQCDITDINLIKELLEKITPDYVIHLAGIAFPGEKNTASMYAINTIGTCNLLEAANSMKKKPQKILLASSATVYGNQDVGVLDESLCPSPANHYGNSKYSMECMAKNFFDKLNIVIARPFNYTGVGQAENFLIPKIVRHFKDNKENIELGNLDVSREFNDVNFVCEVYKRLIESNTSSEIVNVCSGRGIKLLDVIGMMNKIAGYEINVRINTEFVRKNEIKRLVGSPKKLFEIIPKVEQADFRQTLLQMYEN